MDEKTLKQTFALRAVYEQRSCPPDNILFATYRSDALVQHLGYCRYCNERLETTGNDQKEWHDLVQRISPIVYTEMPSENISAGQIWSLDSSTLGGWGPYDRYYTPPLVVVLEVKDKGQTARVAQVCAEVELIGSDDADTSLGGAGFAESWNVYSVACQHLKTCWGNVDALLVNKILMKSRCEPQDAEIGSIIRQFRKLEVAVGAFMAMQALPQVMGAVEEEQVENELLLHKIFGALDRLKEQTAKTVRGWNLPDSAESIYDFLTGFRPQNVPLMAADAGVIRQVNLVREQPNGLLIEALNITITNDDWLDDGTYFIAGKLSRESETTSHLLASLVVDGATIAEAQSQVSPGALHLCIEFSNVSRDACKLENVKMLLVCT